ncbi:hypothetical protein [Streptomyces eurythermus]|uniref:hypothetical protein n=1 Tax=Streptomyces eurythermus TaxID=42237 RepID=UPI0036D308DA
MTAPVAVKVDHTPVDGRPIYAALDKMRPAAVIPGGSTSVRNHSEQIGNDPHRRATDWKAAR